jgi:hypothetical protein
MKKLNEEILRQHQLMYEQNFILDLLKQGLENEKNTFLNRNKTYGDDFGMGSNVKFENFRQATDKIIEDLEGGYYNPSWYYNSKMGKSGETLFGLDRKHGGHLNTTPEGLEFWKLVDQNKNKDVWKYNYKPTGSLGERLRNLLSRILEKSYDNLSKKYLNPESIKIVNSDPKLKFHFIYATWNGPGFFQKFANKLNNRIGNQNILNPNELFKLSMQDRRDSVVASSAPKIEKIFRV